MREPHSFGDLGPRPLVVSSFPSIAVRGIEPLPEHGGYILSGDLDDPSVRIYAWSADGGFSDFFELTGDKRAEVRRWLLGGLALERIAVAYHTNKARETVARLMG